jgi:HAE1 family hydrophobic/amphiphilic exporter-1
VNQLRAKSVKYLKAIIMASRDRLRPIIMTTLTTLLGLLPMAVSSEEGSNLWSPLAITVMGGLASSTILTLLIVPGAYVVSEDMKGWMKGFLQKRTKSGA